MAAIRDPTGTGEEERIVKPKGKRTNGKKRKRDLKRQGGSRSDLSTLTWNRRMHLPTPTALIVQS